MHGTLPHILCFPLRMIFKTLFLNNSPGRFFAIVHIKAVVSRILLNYDIKLTDEGSGRPKDLWFTGIFSAPNKDAKISLKKRNL